MSPPLGKALIAAAAVILVLLSASGCGGGSASGASKDSPGSSSQSSTSAPPPAEVVAEVAGEPITKAEINHWMAALTGQGYYELSGRHTAPTGLASEPPDYGACVKRLEALAAAASPSKNPPSGVRLLGKCRQLYQAMRFEAAKYLVRAHWLPHVAEELGAKANDAEVLAFYRKGTAERFPKPGELTSYLAARRTSIADELVTAKLDVLSNQILEKVKTKGQGVLTSAEAVWKAKTRCHPGYVVEDCSQYDENVKYAPGLLPPSVLLEQVAALATGRCTNLAACAKE